MKTPTMLSVVAAILLSGAGAWAAQVPLQQATATFSQTEVTPQPVSDAIDGSVADGGWAIYPEITNQTAVFETVHDIGFEAGTVLKFTLVQTYAGAGHTLGRFRLSITTDDRSKFADGLASGGDVGARWLVLNPQQMQSANGTTLTELPDHSILASGASPDTDIYTISARTTLTDITGIRLEALQHESLPSHGPGRHGTTLGSGNFVLTELLLEAAPLPVVPSIPVHTRSSETEICWRSQTNLTYQVDYRSKLTTKAWEPLFTNVVGTGEPICVYDTIVRGEPKKSYRVIVSPQ